GRLHVDRAPTHRRGEHGTGDGLATGGRDLRPAEAEVIRLALDRPILRQRELAAETDGVADLGLLAALGRAPGERDHKQRLRVGVADRLDLEFAGGATALDVDDRAIPERVADARRAGGG